MNVSTTGFAFCAYFTVQQFKCWCLSFCINWLKSSSHLILFPFGYMVFNLQIQVFCNSDLNIYLLSPYTIYSIQLSYTYIYIYISICMWKGKQVECFSGLLYCSQKSNRILQIVFPVLWDKFILNHLSIWTVNLIWGRGLERFMKIWI